MMKDVNMQAVLALLVSGGFIAVVLLWMVRPPSGSTEAMAVLNTLAGALGTSFAGVVAYFFASGSGGGAK